MWEKFLSIWNEKTPTNTGRGFFYNCYSNWPAKPNGVATPSEPSG
jgi:hypothetical protein